MWFGGLGDVLEEQGHNERIVAGVSPGGGRSAKRRGFRLSCSSAQPGLWEWSRGILRMLQRLQLRVWRLCASAWRVPELHTPEAQAAPLSPSPGHRVAAAPTRHMPRAQVLKMALFPEGSALRSWARPGVV